VLFIIIILAFMGVMFLSMVNTASLTSVNDLQSTRALYVAEGGTEYARTQFENGTVCDSLTNNNIALDPINIDLTYSTFTTSGQQYNPSPSVTLSSTITAAATIIPVSGDPVAAGYSPQGRIRIEDEEILYSGISGNTFTGAQRGVAGTTAVAHNTIGVPVLQDQCHITSTGTVGNAKRSVAVDVPGYASAGVSAYLDGASIAVGMAETNIGTLQTKLVNGDNLIVAVVSLQKLAATFSEIDILAGNLRLYRGNTLLTSKTSTIAVGGTTTPSATNFPQETQFFVYRDPAAVSGTCPTYNVTARATGTGISAEVKIAVFNNATYSAFVDDPAVQTLSSTADTTINSLPTAFAINDTAAIIAAVQLDNAATATRNIVAGNLELKNGSGATISTSQFDINLARSSRVNRGIGVLLIARETVGVNNPTYTVTGRASGSNVNATAKILAFKGLTTALLDSNSIAVLTAFTSLGPLNTAFPAGDNLIIAAQQYNNTSTSQRNILAGSERIIYNAITQSSSPYAIYLTGSGTTDGNDFTTGLIWHHTGAPANPSYNVQVAASNTLINGETKLLAIHLNINNSLPLFGWRELFP
jgi:Tfp pilus assembly protein PilX